MYQLAVIGNPIAHSLSPLVFSLFAKQHSIQLNYERVLVNDDAEFKGKVVQLFKQGYIALNITSPFKQMAYAVASACTARASFCHASNFLTINTEGQIIADTTDGIGLVLDLQQNLAITIAGINILILGSGYVLDSILLDFIAHNPNNIDILARNSTRVSYLNSRFGTGEFNPKKSYDLIINSSPNTLDNSLFEKITSIRDNTVCYDLAYNNRMFLSLMNKVNQDIYCYSGLGMLVEQAKVAFINLFKVVPDTKLVLQSLSEMGYNV